MKTFVRLVVYSATIILVLTSLVGCAKPTEMSTGSKEPVDLIISVHSNGRINPSVGDTIVVKGDLTLQRNSIFTRIYSSDARDFSLGVWGPDSQIEDFQIRVRLYKDPSMIFGLEYYVKTPSGFKYPMDVNFDLTVGGVPRPLNKIYQAKTSAINNGRILHMGYCHGIKYYPEGDTFIPYGTHFVTDLRPMTVYWDGVSDSTSTGHGLIHRTTPVYEEINSGMTVFLQSSYSDMGKMPMTYNSTKSRYEADILVLPSIPAGADSLTSFQEIFIAESAPSWSQKIYGIGSSTTTGDTELINKYDFDSSTTGQWDLFVLGILQSYRPTNIEWVDYRSATYIDGDIIPH